MINFLFVWLSLLLMMVTGMIVCKFMHINDDFLSRKGMLIFPGVGIIFLVNIVQIFNLFLPVSRIKYVWFLFFLVGLVKFRQFICSCLEAFFKSRKFVVLVVAITVVWMLPFLDKGELVSFQIWNNDIIYYLSSMEWLENHTALQNVSYDTYHPFYWCAEYMLNRTRTGFDGMGALFMSIFELEAHQVFSCLGIICAITLLFHVYYLFSNLFYIPYKMKVVAVLIIALAGRIEELLIYQYIPQLLGISLFLLFLGIFLSLPEQESKIPFALPAFLLSGIIAVYAEFCAYLAVIYIGTVIISLIKGNRTIWKRAWWEGLLGLAFNPVGAYRAIKINIFVLLNLGDGMGNIDPFGGKLASLFDVFAQISGAYEKSSICGNWIISALYLLAISIFLLILLFLWGYYIFKIQEGNKAYCLMIMGFFGAYEVYFRIIGYGYGEYKHLISCTVLFLVLCVYISRHLTGLLKENRMVKAALLYACCFGGLCGGYKIGENLVCRELYYYDDALMETAEAVKLIPGSEPVGISGTAASVHGLVYALKNHASVILSNHISYFPYSEEASARYCIYECKEDERKEQMNERFIWSNGRFSLVENTDLQTAFYTGFHLIEDTDYKYTCDRESSVMVYNYADETKYFSLAFEAEPADDKGGTIRMMVEGDTVAEGETGDYMVTDPLMLNPGEHMRVYIYYDGDLSEKEGKTVGFLVEGLKMITYAEDDI